MTDFVDFVLRIDLLALLIPTLFVLPMVLDEPRSPRAVDFPVVLEVVRLVLVPYFFCCFTRSAILVSASVISLRFTVPSLYLPLSYLK